MQKINKDKLAEMMKKRLKREFGDHYGTYTRAAVSLGCSATHLRNSLNKGATCAFPKQLLAHMGYEKKKVCEVYYQKVVKENDNG